MARSDHYLITCEHGGNRILQGGRRWCALRSQAIETLRQAVARADGRNAP
jgi:hypothetical protein